LVAEVVSGRRDDDGILAGSAALKGTSDLFYQVSI
jgi:hypothetical protein